jgi:GntR family transcriptional regulator, transcriptional repressor for pyruvate dehydrogenase complex
VTTTFEPIRRQSVAAGVFEQLSAQILDGRLAAGEALPAERTLTESFGVNRQAIREALQRLHQLGLVQIRHGDTTRVSDFRHQAGLDLLPRLLLKADGQLDVEVIRSVMEMRAAIGPDAAAWCAVRAEPATAQRLAALAAAMAGPTDLAVLTALDLEFWDLVVDGSENIAYRLALNSLRQSYHPAQAAVSAILADELLDAGGHRAIAAAIERGAPDEARAAATRLLGRGTAAMTEALR